LETHQPPPTLITFDAPIAKSARRRRRRDHTPLQALALMNDPTYVEQRARWRNA